MADINKKVIYPKLRALRSVKDGWEEVYYEVTIDYEALHVMAKVAAMSKGQKAQNGPLTVRILERKPLEQGAK